jgi:hypothetical protein
MESVMSEENKASQQEPVEVEPIDAIAEHYKGSVTLAEVAGHATTSSGLTLAIDLGRGDESFDLSQTGIKPEDFFSGATVVGETTVGEIHDEVIVAAKPKKNALGTQDICPLKDACNHRSADYCKQAKLEADHRRNCIKDHRCDCFHPARGIPQPFRGKL